MEEGESLSKANKGMHHFVSGRSFAVLVALIILSMLVFNHLKKKKRRAEKESTEGASSFPLTPTGGGSGQYDVFLSFRGSDTRKEFTDHLYRNLVNSGTVPISVFRDDISLEIGDNFDSEILDAITRSKISIPIISRNYASSKWCLRELVRIMDCKKNTTHMVLPIFYKVEPSDVRYLKGHFGEAFRLRKKHFDKKDIQEGKQALAEVSYLNGWESENFANGGEGELVEEVIKMVLSKLQRDFQLDVSKNLVGVGYHVNKIRNWLDKPAGHARMIGIYGMGGIGKTTLAKVIYNELSNDFLHRSFLPDIRETARNKGIPNLQNQLIKEIQPNEREVCTVDDGINLIKSRFKGKKVLILLDDIDHQNQLNALARERDWFMKGSVIIVTTRYKGVLDQSEFEVDYNYELEGLDEVHSLLLFERHAFRMDHSSRDFDGISRDIISTMGGLPLALQVIGSYLYGETDRKVWNDVLNQLKEQPHKDVQKVLKISFDALEEGQREIFLDIVCFFIGKECKLAMYMWDNCGFYASKGIRELKLRCLIKIGDDGTFRMHDQLRDLGRSIICQEGSPEIRSRLWDCKESVKVLMEKKGTINIQAICLDEYYGHLQTYTNEQFKNLTSLRFLQLRQAALRGDFNKLFSELRWLQWYDIEPKLSFLATHLHLPKLVVLQLSRNEITEHWRGWSSIMTAKRLKVLDLACCKYLRCTPDLSAFTELEILILRNCSKLELVHPSIGKVKSLVSLDLSDCGSLKELPEEVGELEDLRELILDFSGITQISASISSLRKLEKLSVRACRSLTEIPSSIWDLQNLQHLDLSYSVIEKLPSTIGRLKKLKRLSLQSCRSLKGEIPSEIGDLSSLEILTITSAQISDLPESILNLSSLQHLSLWDCRKIRLLPELPSSLTYLVVTCQSPKLPQLSCLFHLEKLRLYECVLLKHIPELPSRPLKLGVANCPKLILPKLDGFKYLEEFRIQNCKSIERLIFPELRCLKQLKANYCHNLVEIQGLDRVESLEALDISHCGSIERLPDLPCFATLKELNINGCCNLRGVESLEKFLSCRSIYITGCRSLEKLPNLSKFENLENFTLRCSLGITEIPGIEASRSITHIDITACESMETLPDLSGCEKLQSLVVRDCKKLSQLRGLEKLHLILLDISGCDSLEALPELPGTSVLRHYEQRPYELITAKIDLYEKILLQE